MSAKLATRLRTPAFRGESRPVVQVDRPHLGLLLGAGQHMNMADQTRRFDLFVLDLDHPDAPVTMIPTHFFGHGIVPDPVHPERVAVFEKRGKGACEIDLKAGRVTRAIETLPNRRFYGHGAYSADGSLLYATETVVEGKYEGVVAVRDADTHQLLGQFPSFGSSPHDCRLVDGGRVMVITNGGGPLEGIAPSVTYVDVQTEQLIEKHEFTVSHINAGHLDISTAGSLAVVSAQREGLPDKAPGGISLKRPDGVLRTLREPAEIIARMLGETLSVSIHEATGVVGATTPAGNLLTFWDLDSGELLRHYELQNPRGIELTQDGEHFAVSFGFGDPPEALCLISARSLEKVEGYDFAPTGITGSHLLSYSLPAALRP